MSRSRRKRMRRGRRGFVLSEFLLALTIAIMGIPITLGCIRLLIARRSFDENVQDEIGLIQLRRILMCGQNYSSNGSSLQFESEGEEVTLRLVNDHLLLQPGTQIFLSSLDAVSFWEDGLVWHIAYERNGNRTERTLIHE